MAKQPGRIRRAFDALISKPPVEEKSFGGGEGSWRGPFYGMTEFGNWRELGAHEDGYQRNLERTGGAEVSAVYACVMLIARAVSQCTPLHLREDDKGSYNRVTTSPASRILRIPNSIETFHQTILNTVAELLFKGESVWLAHRDDREAIDHVYRLPRDSWTIHVDPESKDVYYGVSVGENDPIVKPDYIVPARNICHFRMHTPRHPLVGESPVKAAAMAVGINVALTRSQLAFFNQMARPSGVLTTDEHLTKEALHQLKAAFDEKSKEMNQGGVPILSHGLKFQGLNVTAADSQLIEQQKMSVAEIARVFGVPLSLVQIDSAAPQAGTEALIANWLSIGLGSVIENIERSLERLFNLPANEMIQLDPTPLMRADMESRISSLAKAVQGSIMTPNEARSRERLGPIDGGDRAFLQRQMVAIDTLNQLNEQDTREQAPPQPEPEPDMEREAAYVTAFLNKAINDG